MAQAQVFIPTSANDATPRMTPGQTWTDDDGKEYKYVLVEDANLAVGDVVEFADTTGYEVTNDRAGGSSLGRGFAGVALGTVTDGQYGVVQIKGVCTVKVPASVAVSAGNALANYTTDGTCYAATTSTKPFVWGMALTSETTSAATTVTAVIF